LSGRTWTGLIWFRIGKMVGYSEDVNKLPGSTKYREFLDELKKCWLLKEDCIQWSQFR
jgi:hypothetical protein